MKTKDLENCLLAFHQKFFVRLQEQHELLKPAQTTQAARAYASTTTNSLIRHDKNPGRFYGRGARGPLTRESVEQWINFPGLAPTVQRVAVGAVIDDGREEDAAEADAPPEGAPVALVVDMNHGWRHRAGGDGPQTLPALHAATGLRPAVQAILQEMRSWNWTMLEFNPDYYHLVAASFFPWTTTKPWVKATRDEFGEELLLRYFGWPNPLEFVSELVQTLYKSSQTLTWDRGLTHVIFHGPPGAIARAGLALAGQLTREPSPSGATVPLYRTDRPMDDWRRPDPGTRMGPDVILCDDLTNLAPGDHPERAIWLWQRSLAGNADGVLEEDE